MTAFVGRQRELEILTGILGDSLSGRGRTVFISGEAGVGKTRLTEELLRVAQSRGARVMKGWCLFNSIAPYMPLTEALRSGNMENLMSLQLPPRLETAFLITNTGLLLSKCERETSRMDSEIFTGMLTAVTEFIKDAIRQMGHSSEGNVSVMRHGDFNISAVHGKYVTIVSVFTGRENEFLLADMETALLEIEKEFEDVLKKWSGKLSEVEGTERNLKKLFDSEKYEGIDWAKDDPEDQADKHIRERDAGDCQGCKAAAAGVLHRRPAVG